MNPLFTASILIKTAGTDGNQYSLGIPPIPIPVANVITPELIAFGKNGQKGNVRLECVLYTPEGKMKEKTKELNGKSYYNQYRLLFIPFSTKNIY